MFRAWECNPHRCVLCSGDKSDSSSYGYEPNYFHNKKDTGNEDYSDEKRHSHEEEDDDYDFGKKIDGSGSGNGHKVQ